MATWPICSYVVTTNVGKVRLHIGDTDCSNYHDPPFSFQFKDEEVQVFLDAAVADGMSGNALIWTASGLALIAWAAAVADEDELVRTGSWTGDRRDVTGKMNAKAQEYLQLAGFTPGKAVTFLSVPVDWDSTVKAERELTDDP